MSNCLHALLHFLKDLTARFLLCGGDEKYLLGWHSCHGYQAARWGVTKKTEKRLDTTQAILETENSSIRSSQTFVSQREKYCYMDMKPSVPFSSSCREHVVIYFNHGIVLSQLNPTKIRKTCQFIQVPWLIPLQVLKFNIRWSNNRVNLI